MTRTQALALKADLQSAFDRNGVTVGLGLTRPDPEKRDEWGVAIRSQVPEVDCLNLGDVKAQ